MVPRLVDKTLYLLVRIAVFDVQLIFTNEELNWQSRIFVVKNFESLDKHFFD
jgi:hypothetical protein